MNNSPRVKKAIKEVIEHLESLSVEELNKELENVEPGFFTNLLDAHPEIIDNAVDVIENSLKENGKSVELPMREIKFRAWDKKTCVWIENIMMDIHTSELVIDECTSYNNDYGLMQYTGMKDRKGVDIYEGDIVKYYWNDENYISEPVPVSWGVYYDGKDHSFLCWKTDDSPLSDSYSEVEVIGNIYENSNLIKK